jgi:hypothetical protein
MPGLTAAEADSLERALRAWAIAGYRPCPTCLTFRPRICMRGRVADGVFRRMGSVRGGRARVFRCIDGSQELLDYTL